MTWITLGALFIGLSLGLLGSGGSILTVPVLVYLAGHQDKTAIAESLAIVGAIALLTMIPYARTRLVDWRSVIFFGVPGMAATYLGAHLSFYISGSIQLVFFGAIMLLAAGMMFRKSGGRENAKTEDKGNAEYQPETKPVLWMIALEGIGVGIITGLVGVGGGFLIVPALVILGRLPMRMAVGTSLAIIALNSMIGFVKYHNVLEDLHLEVDWLTIALFVAIGVAGSLTGRYIGTRLNQHILRRAFAVFLILMGLFVLSREVPHILGPTTKPLAGMAQGSQIYSQLEGEGQLPLQPTALIQ